MTYNIREEERCTCPWPTLRYLCPINPDPSHFELELFTVVPLSVARQRIIDHMVRHHNPGWNMYLTLAMRERMKNGMPDNVLPASIARLLALSNQNEVIEPNSEMLIVCPT